MPALTAAQVLDLVQRACARVLEVDPARVDRRTGFTDDLGADSLGIVEIIEVVEESVGRQVPGFRIQDEDIDALTTVGDTVDHVVARL